MNVAKLFVGCVKRADRCPGVTIDFHLFKLNISPTGFVDKVGRFLNRASDIRISNASQETWVERAGKFGSFAEGSQD